MILYALTVFVSAFLLFQVQPLIARYILPWFGGGPAVWTSSILFFQAMLLVGYAYAHLSVRRLKPRTQIMESVLIHQRVSRSQARRIALDMLDQVHIPEPAVRFNSYPHQLSGGMKQRAMIAMALCCNPDLLRRYSLMYRSLSCMPY